MDNRDLVNEIKLHLVSKKKKTVTYYEMSKNISDEIIDILDGREDQNDINEMALMLYDDLRGKFKVSELFKKINIVFGFEACRFIYQETFMMFGGMWNILDDLK